MLESMPILGGAPTSVEYYSGAEFRGRRYKRIPIEYRLASKIDFMSMWPRKNRDMTVTGACWRWTGFLNNMGYGQIGLPGDSGLAYTHRVMYELYFHKIPDGFVMDHLCRNPSCCNPFHLDMVTSRTNAQRVNRRTVCRLGHNYMEEVKCLYCRILLSKKLNPPPKKVRRKFSSEEERAAAKRERYLRTLPDTVAKINARRRNETPEQREKRLASMKAYSKRISLLKKQQKDASA